MIIVGIVGKFASSPLVPVATSADWPNVPVHKCTSAPRGAVMYCQRPALCSFNFSADSK